MPLYHLGAIEDIDKIRMGIIGTGGIANLHARQLAELPEAEIVAIADPNHANVDKFVSRFGLEEVQRFPDYQDMLEQSTLDAVLICSPHTLHFQQASDVLNKGCHVLIEKPMTLVRQ
ncbi:MAG: oxidoreductase domain protein [Bacilli bacterium]|nr:oxidoreductase domain protein [Bacilli bacterium]